MARVSLTIDNGPDPQVTPRVLDVLEQRGVPATFFVLGSRLADAKNRRLAECAHAERHWIGNHTFSHRLPFGVNQDPDAVEGEVVATERLIGDLARPSPLFRPFGAGGHLDERLLRPDLVEHLTAHAYTCVLWNAVPRDWEQPDAWVAVALEQVRALEEAVVVVHDVIPGNGAQIDRLIGSLRDEGHELVQEFAADCVPIERGKVVRPLDALIGRPGC